MNTKDLIRLGVPPGEPSRRGMEYRDDAVQDAK